MHNCSLMILMLAFWILCDPWQVTQFGAFRDVFKRFPMTALKIVRQYSDMAFSAKFGDGSGTTGLRRIRAGATWTERHPSGRRRGSSRRRCCSAHASFPARLRRSAGTRASYSPMHGRRCRGSASICSPAQGFVKKPFSNSSRYPAALSEGRIKRAKDCYRIYVSSSDPPPEQQDAPQR